VIHSWKGLRILNPTDPLGTLFDVTGSKIIQDGGPQTGTLTLKRISQRVDKMGIAFQTKRNETKRGLAKTG